MTEIERLQKAIKDLHGLDSDHAGSVAVHEEFEGKTVWQGVVEVFKIRGPAKAKNSYAWKYETDNGESRFIAVLELPPIQSPQDAVRAYIITQAKKNST